LSDGETPLSLGTAVSALKPAGNGAGSPGGVAGQSKWATGSVSVPLVLFIVVTRLQSGSICLETPVTGLRLAVRSTSPHQSENERYGKKHDKDKEENPGNIGRR
jgi:hypothetical protein